MDDDVEESRQPYIFITSVKARLGGWTTYSLTTRW
jgi:hypothetical protein